MRIGFYFLNGPMVVLVYTLLVIAATLYVSYKIRNRNR